MIVIRIDNFGGEYQSVPCPAIAEQRMQARQHKLVRDLLESGMR